MIPQMCCSRCVRRRADADATDMCTVTRACAGDLNGRAGDASKAGVGGEESEHGHYRVQHEVWINESPIRGAESWTPGTRFHIPH